MKKNFIYALMSAIALTGAVSLTSCSSNDNLEDINPTYDGKTVKTQINIGLTSKVGNPTRMAYETVQAAQTYGSFRGMEKIKLISFDKNVTLGTETRLGSIIALANISGTDLTASDATKTATHTEGGANYLVYEDVSVPQGTTNFLFYGKAPSDDFAKGKLTVSNLDDAANKNTTGYTGEFTDPGHVKFTPTSIVDPENDNKVAANNSAGSNLLTLLNAVASASAKIGTKKVADAADESYVDISGTSHTTTAANEVYIDYATATLTNWKDVTETQNKTLYNLFQSFKALTSNSSFNVQRTLQDLYNTLNDIITVKATGFEVAEAIQTAIKGDNSDESTTNTYNDGEKTLALGTAYRNYPSDLHLPDGAARISWDNVNFVFYDVLKHNNDNSGSVADNTSTATLFSSYAYPADLWYTANTALKASTVKQSGNFGTTNNWATILSTNYSSSTDVVSGATRSVALVNEINYAVGRLDISINPLAGKVVDETTTLTDYYDSKGNKFDFSSTGAFKDGFTLTGVLIGNQKQVGWDFTTTSAGATLDGKEYVIYDKTMNNSASPIVALTPSSGSGTNYTLVLETTKDADVNIALEFKNNGADFFGKNGQLIPAGGTFYLTGKLTPAYGGEKYGEVGGKVFKQDYYTTAIITIDLGDSTVPDGEELVGTPKGFQLATNTIPDLRTPQLELCFSVNLQWNEGLTFRETW